MEGRKLGVWLGHADEEAPLPATGLASSLYTPPNLDGTRKMCGNCVLWMGGMQQCFIHDGDVLVPDDAVCGYHVFGTPASADQTQLSRDNFDPVAPELSGLDQTDGGSSCDLCGCYCARGSTQGMCRAFSALVAALGRCARWIPRRG